MFTVGNVYTRHFSAGIYKKLYIFSTKGQIQISSVKSIQNGSSLILTEGIVIRKVKLKIYQLFVEWEKEPHDRYMVKVRFSCLNVKY